MYVQVDFSYCMENRLYDWNNKTINVSGMAMLSLENLLAI